MASVPLPPVEHHPDTMFVYRPPSRLWWGEGMVTGGLSGRSGKFGDTMTLNHVLPIPVRDVTVEHFMAPKALQSDVGSLMPLTHNTKRRTPRHPTPAVFPTIDPLRRNTSGSYVLGSSIRNGLDQCTSDLYTTPRYAKTQPDHSAEIRRNIKLERCANRYQRTIFCREPMYDYERFRYTTEYRESFSKTSLEQDQSKTCLPPIQRKISYANTRKEEEVDENETEADTSPAKEETTEGTIPYSESLSDIRNRLRREGWLMPPDPLPYNPADDDETVQARRKCIYYKQEVEDNFRPPSRNRISANLVKSTQPLRPIVTPLEPVEKCSKFNLPKVAQTRIAPQSRPSSSVGQGQKSRSSRRVTFDLNQQEVENKDVHEPYFSQREAPEDRKCWDNGDFEAEFGNDEMLKMGFRRKTRLPVLQVPHFKSYCHSRYHTTHQDPVPDLRDFRTYYRRVVFNGIKSSVFRG